MKNAFQPVLVALVGGSGAGKTWLANQLAARLSPDVATLCCDCFYTDRSHFPPARRARINFDHPRALDWELMEQTLLDCAMGRPMTLPQYDFKSHCRFRSRAAWIPRRIVLVEGLWLLHRKKIRDLFDFSVFIRCPRELRQRRRLQRDTVERGRDSESVLRQLKQTVFPMHSRYVEPQRQYADLVVEAARISDQLEQIAEKIRGLSGFGNRNQERTQP